MRCWRCPWLSLTMFRLFPAKIRVLRLGVAWAQPPAIMLILFLLRSRNSSSVRVGRVVTFLTEFPLRSSLESSWRPEMLVTGIAVRLLSGRPRALRTFSRPVKAFLSTEERDPVETTRPESWRLRLWNSFPSSRLMFFTERSSRVTLFSAGKLATSFRSLLSWTGPSEPGCRMPSHL